MERQRLNRRIKFPNLTPFHHPLLILVVKKDRIAFPVDDSYDVSSCGMHIKA